MSPKYPKFLQKGDTLGIISPSSTNDRVIIERGTEFLENQGYRVIVHPQNYAEAAQLAGSDTEKIDAIMHMFADPTIDGIICARGGNGAIRLLDKIDYELIARNPKPFVGYSDITVLLHAFYKKSGLICYHGPMVSSFGGDFDPRTASDFFAQIEGRLETLDVTDIDVLQSGEAEGILIGGNMTMLQNLVATPFDWETNKAILFIEDVDEVLYRIDRMLHHFKFAGKLASIAAILVGEMINVPDGETSHMRRGEKPYGFNIKQILRDHLPSAVPICMNFPCGHGRYITTLPMGGHTRLKLEKNRAELTFKPS